MNPVTKLMSWVRGPTSDPESRAEARRIRENRDTIRISQESSQFGIPTNVPPTPNVLDPGREDSHNSG
jgi:hypothetical protein